MNFATSVAPGRPPGLYEHTDVTEKLDLSCEVVVVGSGAGGATMAAELAEAGLDVIILEEGGYHPTQSFGTDGRRGVRELYRDAGAQAAIGRPPIIFSEGRCVGGSTTVNGGMSWRTPERILERWEHQEGVVGVSPAEMERHFERVERRISVGYQDPETIGRDAELLKLGADRKGWKIIPNLRNQLHCAGSNNCALGCPTGAKRSTLVTYVPRALSWGARLYANCRVDRVTHHRGRVTGVQGRIRAPGSRPGPKVSVRAPIVVVAGGSVQTPALLMRSGFKSPSKQLGRNLTLHPNAKVIAIFDEDVHGWHGVHQAFQVRQFIEEGILLTAINVPPAFVAMGLPHHGAELGEIMQDYNRMMVAGVLIEDSTSGTVRNLPLIGATAFYNATEQDVRQAVRGIALTAELMFEAGARRILLPFSGVPDLRSPDDIQRLYQHPIRKDHVELVTVHLMGTCRMSDDPKRGVVSSYGAFHGMQGLFVADASLFPTSVGVNPMETIMGLVTRNAEWLIENRRRYL